MAERRQQNAWDDVAYTSPRCEVDELLEEAEGHIDRLRNEKQALKADLESLKANALFLQQEITRSKARLRRLNSAPDTLGTSTTQGADALWPWEPPKPVPVPIQGVYRLLKKGRTVYIGQSVNIMSRVAHACREQGFRSVFLCPRRRRKGGAERSGERPDHHRAAAWEPYRRRHAFLPDGPQVDPRRGAGRPGQVPEPRRCQCGLTPRPSHRRYREKGTRCDNRP